MYRAGFIPSLEKERWREAPGWFEAAILQLRSDSCMVPNDPGRRTAGAGEREWEGIYCALPKPLVYFSGSTFIDDEEVLRRLRALNRERADPRTHYHINPA
jgi:hypothetical protein